jgi:hypothetical protein
MKTWWSNLFNGNLPRRSNVNALRKLHIRSTIFGQIDSSQAVLVREQRLLGLPPKSDEEIGR